MAESIIEKPRIDYIDLAKGVCIIMVVFLHCDCHYKLGLDFNENMGTSFRMPLYFLLSGLFFKSYGGWLNFLKKKTNKLLIPFSFFFLVTSVLLPMVVNHLSVGDSIKPAESGGLQAFIALFDSDFYFSNLPIWFLLCLFGCNILFYMVVAFAEKINKNRRTLFITASCLLFGYFGFYLGKSKIDFPFFLDTSMTALPFFAGGFLLRKYTSILVPNKFDKYQYLTIPLLWAASFLVSRGFNSSGGVSFYSNSYDVNIYIFYIAGFVGTLAVLFTAKAFTHVPFVSYVGRYSIMVLVTHMPLIKFVAKAIDLKIENPMYACIATTTLLLMSYLIIIPIMRKYLSYVTAQKDLIK